MKTLVHVIDVIKIRIMDKLATLDPPKPKNHKRFMRICDILESQLSDITTPIRLQLYLEVYMHYRKANLEAKNRRQHKNKITRTNFGSKA